MSGRSIIVGFLTVIAVIVGVFLIARNGISFPFGKKTPTEQIQLDLDDPRHSTHYQNSSPAHGQVFAEIPAKIVIHTTQAMTVDSQLTINYDGVDFSEGSVEISKDIVSRTMKSDSPDGIYTVSYTTCSAANDCENGQFQFVLDRLKQDMYTDLRGQSSVTILIKDDVLNPQRIIIDSDTVVMWENADSSEVYAIASAPHPSRAVFPALNTSEIREGEIYSAVFERSGEYEYYDRIHADAGITGRVVVQ